MNNNSIKTAIKLQLYKLPYPIWRHWQIDISWLNAVSVVIILWHPFCCSCSGSHDFAVGGECAYQPIIWQISLGVCGVDQLEFRLSSRTSFPANRRRPCCRVPPPTGRQRLLGPPWWWGRGQGQRWLGYAARWCWSGLCLESVGSALRLFLGPQMPPASSPHSPCTSFDSHGRYSPGTPSGWSNRDSAAPCRSALRGSVWLSRTCSPS